jgi:hypothetical protein
MRIKALQGVLGVVLPLLLLRFDPFLLSGWNGDSLLGSLSQPVYVLLFLSMLAFLGQLFAPQRMVKLAGISAGVLMAGCLLSLLLAGVLLPFSIVAIRLYGYGLLGLYPWVAAFLYFRAARSAMRRSGIRNPLWPIAGFIFAVAIPLVLVGVANREIIRLAAHAGTIGRSTAGWRAEQFLTWAGDSDRIVSEYEHETKSPARKENLGKLYQNLRGQDIEARLEQLRHSD